MDYQDTVNAIKFLVECGNIYYVDSDGYVRERDKDTIAQVRKGKETADLMIFQEVIKDNNAVILNPFAEGLSETVAQNWLFKYQAMSLIHKILDFSKFIVELVLNQKLKSEVDNKVEISTALNKLISPYMAMTKTTLSDIDKIASYDDFMSIGYKAKFKEASLRCGLFEGPSLKEKYSAVQVKTWKFLEDVVCMLLKIDPSIDNSKKMDEFKFKSTVLGYPRLDAKLNLLYMIYERANDCFDLMDNAPSEFTRNVTYSIDLTEFGHHLSNLVEYYKVAKSFIQTTKVDTPSVPEKAKVVSPGGIQLPVTHAVTTAAAPGQRNVFMPGQVGMGVPGRYGTAVSAVPEIQIGYSGGVFLPTGRQQAYTGFANSRGDIQMEASAVVIGTGSPQLSNTRSSL